MVGNMPVKQAFDVADNLIATMIKGITETISEPALVNLDYADVKAIMQSGGVAAIGVGESEADKKSRASEAITKAMNNPLIDVDYDQAKGALIQIIGGEDMTLDEINSIGEVVSGNLNPDAQIIWGAKIIPEYKEKIQVITIVTGVKSPFLLGPGGETKKYSNDLGIEQL